MLNNLSSNTKEQNTSLNMKTKCLQEQIDGLVSEIHEIKKDTESNSNEIDKINNSTSLTKQTANIDNITTGYVKADEIYTKQIRGCPSIDYITSNIVTSGVVVTDCIPNVKTETVNSTNVHTDNLTAENATIDCLVVNCPVEINSINNDLYVTGDIAATNGISSLAGNFENYVNTNTVVSKCLTTETADVTNSLVANKINTHTIKADDENVGKIAAGSITTSNITSGGSIVNTDDNAYLVIQPFTGTLNLSTEKYSVVINGSCSNYEIQFSQKELNNLNDITLKENHELVLHIEDPSSICYTSHTIAPVNFSLLNDYEYNTRDYTIDVCGAGWNEHSIILNRNCYGSGLCINGLLKADRLSGEAMEVPNVATCCLTSYNCATLTQNNNLGDLTVRQLPNPEGEMTSGNAVFEENILVCKESEFDGKLTVCNSAEIADNLNVAKTITTDVINSNNGCIKTLNSNNVNITNCLCIDGDTTGAGATFTNLKADTISSKDTNTFIENKLISTDGEIHTPNISVCNIKPYSDNNNTLDVSHNNVSVKNLTVTGNLIQTGSSYDTHAEDLYIKDSCIKLRDGATVAMSNTEKAGLSVLKYNGTDDMNLFVDNNGIARLGKQSSLQPLTLRNEETSMTNGKLVCWNSADKRVETSTCSVSDIDTKITNCYNNVNNKITALCSGDIAYKNKANTFTCLQTINGGGTLLCIANICGCPGGAGVSVYNVKTGCHIELCVDSSGNGGIYDLIGSKWLIHKNNCKVYINECPAVCVTSFDASSGTLCLG